jgi:hypothetical protein
VLVESSPSPPVHDVSVEPLSMPIARSADPAFREPGLPGALAVYATRGRGAGGRAASRWPSPSSWDLSHWDSIS